VLGSYFGVLFGLKPLTNWATRPIGVLQIPVGSGPLRFDNSRFIDAMKRTNTEVHFWTINDPEEMQRLAKLGASGIVTDRADLALATLR
jgi:glycerophosphoryl diester phosphodiesterase